MHAIQLTLTTAAVNLLSELREVDEAVPGECRTLLVQADAANTEESKISVGDASISTTRYGYQLQPDYSREYSCGGGNLEPRVSIGGIWVKASEDGLKLNVEVMA